MHPSHESGVKRLISLLEYEIQEFHQNKRSLDNFIDKNKNLELVNQIKGENIILVAEEDDQIIGLCWISVVDRGIDKQAEINEFYVESDFRKKGIGKKLLEEAKAELKKRNTEVIFVWTHEYNKKAINLYKKSGFKKSTQVVYYLIP